MYFRITCRTADWSYNLEEYLKEKWGEDHVGVYELAPLRRIDVIEAASKSGIEPENFLQEVFNKKAIPLAIKPVSLSETESNINQAFKSSKSSIYF